MNSEQKPTSKPIKQSRDLRKSMRQKIGCYVSKWERQGYADGLPESAPVPLEDLSKVPSWRLICKAIMKNDYALETLGYSREKCPAYMMLKKIELRKRNEQKA